MKIFCTLLFLSLFTFPRSFAQDILFSEPVKKVANSSTSVLGKVGRNFIVCEETPRPHARKILRVFDQKMQQVGDKKIISLPAGALNVNIAAYDANLLLTYVEKQNEGFLFKAVKMNERAEPIGLPVVIDSFADPLKRPGTWDLVASADKKKLLISRIAYSRDSALISTRILTSGLELLQQSEAKLFLQYPGEVPGNMLLSNSGDIYFPVYPLSPGGLVNRFEILSRPFGEHAYRSVLIDMKQRFLHMGSSMIRIDERANNSSLVMNASYYPGNSHTVIEGLFTARVNAATNQLKAVLNKLNDSSLSGESTADRASWGQVQLDDIFFLNNGAALIVGKLDKGKMLTYARPRSYLDMNVNPRFIYDPAGYRFGGGNPGWNPDMYMNPGANSSLTLPQQYNKDIVVCYLDSSLTLRQQKVIKKNQADLKKTDQFYLDFGIVNTSTAVHFLYREVKKGGGLIRNTSFSPNGGMQRLPPLRTVDDLYKLIPALAKQVGLRQVIIPGTYRGKMVFAKVDL